MENLKREYGEDRSKVNSVINCLGDKYKFWGMIEMRFHLVCPPKGGTLFLLGTDRLGRDMFSRIVIGTDIAHRRTDWHRDQLHAWDVFRRLVDIEMG